MSKVKQVKKMEDGLYVQWVGSRRFYKIPDTDVANYLIYTMVNSPKSIVENQNSMCR